MNAFRYQAVEGNGGSVSGVIEAEDRKMALSLLGERGLFPSSLEAVSVSTGVPAAPSQAAVEERRPASFRLGNQVKRKEITAFTREMGALLAAAIPIPQALEGLGEEEDNPALKAAVLQ